MNIAYVIIYVAINVYRFSKIAEYLDFRFKSKQLYTILFWDVRVLVIAGLTCFMFLTFQEYVMFCYAKMIVITLILFVIHVVEALSLVCNIDDDAYIAPKLIYIYMIVVSCIGTILFCFFVATSITKQYYKVEEKERVIYDGSKNVKTTIYAPLSAYTGISFDAK